jgi:O-antigen ligase
LAAATAALASRPSTALGASLRSALSGTCGTLRRTTLPRATLRGRQRNRQPATSIDARRHDTGRREKPQSCTHIPSPPRNEPGRRNVTSVDNTDSSEARRGVLEPGRLADTADAASYVVFLALAAGALGCVLAVLPFRTFELDRFFVPKELALHTAAAIAGLAALASIRRLTISRADAALLAWLAVSVLSTLFATNHWLAVRALSVSVSSAAVFWSARRIAAAGLGGALVSAMALAVVAGALTALAQAYGVQMEFASLSRAPGGTFGNRNFMAHLAGAGLPLLLWCVIAARTRLGSLLSGAGLLVCTVAIVLSRTRAAWLALMVWAIMIALVLWRDRRTLDHPAMRRRARRALGTVAAGVVLALVLPNTLDWRSDNPYLDSVMGVVNFREGSGRGRMRQYTNSLHMAAAHPVFGVGPGNWPVVYPAFAPSSDASLSDATGMAENPWPSSDWIAAVAERGMVAAVAFGILALALAAAAWRAWRDASVDPRRRLAILAGASVLAIAMVEGLFDAVLLLPAPAIIAWSVAGALIPTGRAWRVIDLTPRHRHWIMGAFAIVSLSASALSGARISAMSLYDTGRLTAIERASHLDPGSFRIRLRAAELYAARGSCADARRHALAARALFPNASGPKRVLSRCAA